MLPLPGEISTMIVQFAKYGLEVASAIHHFQRRLTAAPLSPILP